MTKFYVKVTSFPSEMNPVQNFSRVEYWGIRECHLSSLTTPSPAQLELYGFGSKAAAEKWVERRKMIDEREFKRFHSWNHTYEIVEETIS